MQYEHMCTACSHEWEEEYKMSDPIPDKCPKCKKKGKVKRLISSGISGKCPLVGKELTASLWAEGKKMAREAKTNEKKAANYQGESNYHNMKLTESRLNRDLKGILK
jgi:putative FmdB family regulatory protein